MPEECSGEECTDAYSNPKCPYLNQINQNTQISIQTHNGLVALLGEDLTGLNGGVIRTLFDKIGELKRTQEVQSSWVNNLKPIVGAVAGIVLTALLEYWFLKGF